MSHFVSLAVASRYEIAFKSQAAFKGQTSAIYPEMQRAPNEESGSRHVTVDNAPYSERDTPRSYTSSGSISRFTGKYVSTAFREAEREIITLKILVIGDPGVGKTAFISSYVEGKFLLNYRQTIGVDFFHKLVRLKSGQLVRLQLWDIAGQERQRRLFRVYYRDANGCILMFDLTNPASLAHVEEWKEELNRHCALPNGDEIPCLLVGNKCDLVSDEVYASEVQNLLHRHNFIGFRHVSAKDGSNVASSMEYLTDTMIAKWLPQTATLIDPVEVDRNQPVIRLPQRVLVEPTDNVVTEVIHEKRDSCC